MTSGLKHLYEFGPFLLDTSERTLMRGEQPVHLTPKEFDTLAALVRGAGRVMPKEELLKEIWHDTFVGEATLAQNIFTLRKALGEAEDGKSYIETIPRRGYKFAAKVFERQAEIPTGTGGGPVESRGVLGEKIERRRPEAEPTRAGVESVQYIVESANGDGGHVETGINARTATLSSKTDAPPLFAAKPDDEVSHPLGDTGHPVLGAIVISIVVFTAVAALVYGVFRFSIRPQTESTPRASAFQSMKVQRLPVMGAAQEAAISPDGKLVAYVANEPGSQEAGIWIRQVATASNAQRIVAPVATTFYGGLVFSPDSQHLYFASGRADGNSHGSLSRLPVLGGPIEKVIDRINGPASFAPDGKRLVFERAEGDNRSLVIAGAEGHEERTLVTRPGPTIFGLPAWSPDGKRIACVYGSLENLNSSTPYLGVTSFDAASGAETKVTDERWVGITQLSWLPDSAGIVLSAAEQELSPSQIWQLSFPSGELRRVTNDLNTYNGASLTADGSALVTVQTDRIPNIWVAPGGGDSARARQITSGAGKFDGYYGLAWMPDGRIVYSSIASGSWDIWMMNADGSGQKQLTVGARSSYGPSVSSDGRHIVFVSNRAGGTFNVWRMDADGSNPKQLSFGKGENFAHITPDGQWVVYATVGFGQKNIIWKVSIDGGEPVQLTDEPSSWPFISPDGKSFVCTYGVANQPGKLAVIPIDGGKPTKLFDIPPSFRANTVWLPDNRGIAFLDARDGTTNVWMQPLAGGKPVRLTDFKTDGVSAYDFARDGRLVASRSVETTSVILLRDFH